MSNSFSLFLVEKDVTDIEVVRHKVVFRRKQVGFYRAIHPANAPIKETDFGMEGLVSNHKVLPFAKNLTTRK